MTDLLWQKPGVRVDERIQQFCAGDDVVLDREFFAFDIQASRAHAQGLQRIGILSPDELAGIERELDALADDFAAGRFVLDARFEDGHSAIEARLVERLGDAGRRIHTGRSRNDQVLVATRLWLKDRLAQVHALCRDVAEVALARADAEAMLPLRKSSASVSSSRRIASSSPVDRMPMRCRPSACATLARMSNRKNSRSRMTSSPAQNCWMRGSMRTPGFCQRRSVMSGSVEYAVGGVWLWVVL